MIKIPSFKYIDSHRPEQQLHVSANVLSLPKVVALCSSNDLKRKGVRTVDRISHKAPGQEKNGGWKEGIRSGFCQLQKNARC